MLSASGLLLGQAVLPYTFTTAELEALKTKLMTAEQAISSSGKGQHTVLQISLAEVKTLLRMIDMTYLQGLSASGYVPTTMPSLPTAPMHAAATVNAAGPSGQPPATYVCHKCGVPGHYVQDCQLSNRPNNQGGQRSHRGPPPANYVCHKCSKPGHWIQDCPVRVQGNNGMAPNGGGMNNGNNSNNSNNSNFQQNRYHQKQPTDYTKPPPPNYICHRCRIAGHWIRNCPTNGDPSFDKNSNQLQQPNQSIPNPSNLASGSAANTDSTGEPPAAKKRKGLNGAAIQ